MRLHFPDAGLAVGLLLHNKNQIVCSISKALTRLNFVISYIGLFYNSTNCYVTQVCSGQGNFLSILKLELPSRRISQGTPILSRQVHLPSIELGVDVQGGGGIRSRSTNAQRPFLLCFYGGIKHFAMERGIEFCTESSLKSRGMRAQRQREREKWKRENRFYMVLIVGF